MDIDGREFELETLYVLEFGKGATVVCRSPESATSQIGRWLSASQIEATITIRVARGAVVEQKPQDPGGSS